MIIISFKRVKPTKTILLRLQKKLNFVLKGENYLEFKREQLIHQINRTWNDYRIQQKEFFILFKKVMINLNHAYREMGKRNFKLISKLNKIKYKPLVSIRYRKKAGLTMPHIEYELLQERQLPAYSFEHTSHYLDELIIVLKNFFKNLIILAENEDVMLKLAFDFKKINRRINGLKNLIIPQLQIQIKKIKDKLEEYEREQFVRLKSTKNVIKKKSVRS